MKAVIMAGGEGTRLRPISLGHPKPMTSLLGRPVMEHIINLLKGHGITDICITLCYQPQQIMDYFGGGEAFGVTLTYFVEDTPLGTAGSVKGCMGHLGQDDFLVISGDCVCDLNLTALLAFHQAAGAETTLALYPHSSPLEYGLVITGPDGRVQGFVEKPSWGQVVTNQINTGIYLLSPAAMSRVPEQGAYDFGKDLFPALLGQGAGLYGCLLSGYWCDMGDCKAYLDCVCDALDGRVALEIGLPQRSAGVWCAESAPPEVTLAPPCWIGPEVQLAPGVQIGPHVVLDRGCTVGEHAALKRSVLLERAAAGPKTVLDGAILCSNSVARRGATLSEGAVLGENALAEEGAVLLERVKLWPGQTAPAGCHLKHSITSGSQRSGLCFGDGGVIRGILGEDIGPEALLALGGILGGEGWVGLGCSDHPAGRMLTRAAAAGIAAAGGQTVVFSLDCPMQAAWVAQRQDLPVTLFIEVDGGPIYLHLFDRRGLPLGRARERKLEHALLQGEVHPARWEAVGKVERLAISTRTWADGVAQQAALGWHALRRVTVAVGKDSPVDRAIRAALLAIGCQLEDRWRPGIPAFSGSHGGFRLSAQDEKGALLDSGQLLAVLTLIEMENGGGKVAIPPEGSAAVDLVSAGYGGLVLRLDRDGEPARALYADLPWLWSAASAAVRICARMGVSGQGLDTLVSKTPRFSAWRREVPLRSDRGRVMQALAGEHTRTPAGDGLRVRTGGGWVYLTPLARRAALRVVAEGPDLEVAAELCDFFANRAAALDRETAEQDIQKNGG